MEPDGDVQVIRADKELRRKVVLFSVMGGIAALGALHFFFRYLQRIEAMAAESPARALERLGAVLPPFLLAAVLPLFAGAAWLVWMSVKTWRADRFPPPGVRVIRDTRVVTGKSARRRAVAGLVAAFLVCGLAVFLPWQVWILLAALRP